MNIMDLSERETLEQAINNLAIQINKDAIRLDNLNGDANATIQIFDICFKCVVRGCITNANFNTTLQSLLMLKEKSHEPVLLIARQIYPRLMKQFAEYDINVIDYVGNCVIRHFPLFLMIKGEKNNQTKESLGRAFQEAGIKLIFHFLRYPESVKQPYRVLQRETGISLGAINNVIEELISEQFVLVTKEGRFLKNKLKLLEIWINAYNQILKPKLLMSRMTFRNEEKRENWTNINLPEGMSWGGESGAHLTDGYLLPGEFTIYTQTPTATILKSGFFIPDKKGEVKIYKKFWKDEYEERTVPPLLIYADLMGSGNSRCLEAAQIILNDELRDLK